MPEMFLPNPFADTDMLEAILDDLPPPRLQSAALEDHAVSADPGGARIALCAAAGSRAQGALATATPEAAARLGFALAGLGGPAEAVNLRVAGRQAQAFVSAEAAGADWPAAPDPEWRAHLAEVASEAASLFGRRPASEVPRLLQGMSYRALGRVRGLRGTTPVLQRRGYGAGDLAPIGLERPYAKYFAVEEHRLRHRRFDGAMSRVVERAVFASGDAVTVLPYDPRTGRVLLIEQFRIGPYARKDPHPWCLETVAGRCDAGEGPEGTARREAREEAGIELGRIARVGGYYTSPGVMSEHITAFVGEADLAAAGGTHGLAAEDEDIRAIVLPLEEALDLVAAGEVNNAPLLVSLLWLGRQADQLRAAWRDSTPA